MGGRAARVRRPVPPQLAAGTPDRADRDRQPRRVPQLGPILGHHRRRDPRRRRLRRPHPAVTIAVTGATGEVGRRVIAMLDAPRLVVRDASRAPDGYDVRAASDYGALDEMRAALAGASTLFLIPAGESADRVDRHRTAVDAAVAAGVGRIVYLSFLNAAPDATFTLARDHWHTEEHIRACGVPWTFLRMNLYMDFIPGMAGTDGVIRGPAGSGRVAAILRDDVAASAAAVLGSTGHEGRTYDLTGPSNFSLAEAAALLGVTYVD